MRETLIAFALWLSPTWEEGNEDDREEATIAVDAFLAGGGPGPEPVFISDNMRS